MATRQTHHQKKRLFLLMAGRECPLTGFNGVLAYSFLVYRLKMAKGHQGKSAVTIKQIERGTGLSRSRTIPKAIEILEAHGLLGRADRGVFAHQGQASEWFVQMRSSQHKPWFARFAYLQIWIPSSGPSSLTPRQNALYWLIGVKPGQRQVYYAMRLGIDEKTVARAVTRLRRLELISWSRLEHLELQPEHLTLWQDESKRNATQREFRLSELGILSRFSALNTLGWSDGHRERFEELLDGYGNRMRSAGYSKVEVTGYWEATATQILTATNDHEPFERFVIEFGRIFRHVEQVTLRNRVAGTFNGANSLGLLNKITQQAVEELQVVWRNHLEYGSPFGWSWSGPT